jgi:hypothetical protein
MLRGSVVLLMLLGASACSAVKATERGNLARASMQVGLGEEGFSASYRAKLVESRMGAGLPGSAPGGGCGCAQ